MNRKNANGFFIYSCYIIITLIVLLSYSNTFNASWHFDDFDNILTNQPLHLFELTPSALIDTFFANPAHPSQKLFHRPIANLSFALNWYWGDEHVWGYHLVNIIIHSLTAIFLFATILRLYQTPALSTTDPQLVGKIALLATLFWALNPIQTQAITYIVQRMASMAAMFSIMALYCYVKARQADSSWRRWMAIAGSLICFLLAAGTKENAAILPGSVVLIEIIFFHPLCQRKYSPPILLSLFVTAIAAALFLACFLGDKISFLAGYEARSFTLAERLLTEPRIVVFYLSQLFYPANYRLSLEHDVTLSQSLFDPWTTLPALALLAGMLAFAILSAQKKPLVSFAILFFFLNHLVESTIVPLELVFEHRNYLPSLFLFLPVADYLVNQIARYRTTFPTRSSLLTFFSVLLVIVLAFGTYLRNTTWLSEDALWRDAVNKAPKSSRAAYGLGNEFVKAGQLDEALVFLTRAVHHSSSAPTPLTAHIQALNGIGWVHLLAGQPELAISFFEKVLTLSPSEHPSRFNLALAYFSLHKWDDALVHARILLEKDKNNIDYLYLEDLIRLQADAYGRAEKMTSHNTTKKSPKNANLCLLLAASYKKEGQFISAERYIEQYDTIIQNNLTAKLLLLDIYDAHHETLKKEKIIDEIISQFSTNDIESALLNNSMMGMELFSGNRIKTILMQRHNTNTTESTLN